MKMEIGKPFKARIYGFDGGPAIDDGRDFILLQLAVPADIGVSPGIVEVTLLETGGLGRDMLDTELSPDREETGK